MIGTNNLPEKAEYTSVFGVTGATVWQTWQKPAGCKMVHIFCIGGGGGGGGGGKNSGSTTPRSGGGGGGSSSITTGLFNAAVLPDYLFVLVGLGGAGGAGATGVGAGGGSGGAGSISYVSIQANTTTQNILLQSGATAAGGATGTTGGTGGTAWSFLGNILYKLGHVSVISGLVGASGSTIAGPSVTIASILTPGAAGAGSGGDNISNAGGSITGSGLIPTVQGGTAGGGSGNAGFRSRRLTRETTLNPSMLPLIFTGGSGGGSNGTTNGSGGAGGAGSFGCGGGGGASGTTTGNGGDGGPGGGGLVVITTW